MLDAGLRRPQLGDRRRFAPGVGGAGLVGGDRRRGRADPRDPGRRRQFAIVPALRPSRPRRKDAARLHRRKPGIAPRSVRARPPVAEPDADRAARRRGGRRYARRRRRPPLRWPQAARTPGRGGGRGAFAAAPFGRHPHARMALSPDRHRRHGQPPTAACRHRGRAFPAGRAVRDPADDRQPVFDRVDRAGRPGAAADGLARGRLRRRAGGAVRRFSRTDRAGRAALVLSAGADAWPNAMQRRGWR